MEIGALDAGRHTGRPPLTDGDQRREARQPHAEGRGELRLRDGRMDRRRGSCGSSRRNSGVGYHPAHVSKILHSMSLSWQKAEGVARERDEAKVKEWVHETLPEIKKADRDRRDARPG